MWLSVGGLVSRTLFASDSGKSPAVGSMDVGCEAPRAEGGVKDGVDVQECFHGWRAWGSRRQRVRWFEFAR